MNIKQQNNNFVLVQKAIGGIDGRKSEGVRVETKNVRVGTSNSFQHQL